MIITHVSWTTEERLEQLFPFWIDMAIPLFMIITGYLYAKSYEKHQINSIKEAYQVNHLLHRFIRYTVPFIIFFVSEEIIFMFQGRTDWGYPIVKKFLEGGVGPGSYYYPVMLQCLLCFPIIFTLIEKLDLKGLKICGCINLLYEVIQRVCGMTQECYRLLFFRYILVVAFGCYLAIGKEKIHKKSYMTMLILGLLFIISNCYGGYQPYLLIYWTRTSFLACFYIIPISEILIKRVNFSCKTLEILGKASYNIFLIQMLYYTFFSSGLDKIASKGTQIILNIIICCSIGVLFYIVESPITRFIDKKVCAFLNNTRSY